MKIVFRADASIWIGSGHIMRCLVLANALKELNYHVMFACLPQRGDLIDLIEERGFKVIRLTLVDKPWIPRYDADYEAWLQRPIKQDVEDFVDKVSNADLVITDHYAIDYLWQNQVKNRLSCKIVAIDDLVRKHDAEIIIDQTLGRSVSEYESDGIVLTGPRYALLSKQFLLCREAALERANIPLVPRILISMGGIDAPDATSKVLSTLINRVDALFTVLLSPRAPNYEQVKIQCSRYSNVVHHDFVYDMAKVMIEHDIAIGAPGSTCWERACLGLPSIVIPIADNQKEICRQLVENRVSIKVELQEIDNRLFVEFDNLVKNWKSFYWNSINICDGLGTQRVIKNIIRLDNENYNYL